MKIERISKPYWNSSKKESLAIIIPKVIRDALEITPDNYVKWELHLDSEEGTVIFKKLE